MVPSVMTVQEQDLSTRSNETLAQSDGFPSNASGVGMAPCAKSNDQISSLDDFTPKVRKPYTITKQRERWTEEDHNKFVEALKLYGRAWRRIEEHVGTKSAVQIRSHAQKFFTKVVRESSGNNTNSNAPIEIPPPRPKRKPMHPYPRKMMHSHGKESLTRDEPSISSSQNPPVSCHENQSPTSVLSGVNSDVLGSSDSNTPNHNFSPVSSAAPFRGSSHTSSGPSPSAEGSTSGPPMLVKARSGGEEQSAKARNFKLFLDEQASSKELSNEQPTRTLKLFGRTVLVTRCRGPSSPTNSSFRVLLPETNKTQYAESVLQFRYGDLTSSLLSKCHPEALYHVQDKEIQKEGSCIDSNSGSDNDGNNVNRSISIESETCCQRNAQGEKCSSLDSELKPSPRVKPCKSTKGFMPYKRNNAERDSQWSIITGEDREEQRIRLSL